MVMDGDLTGGGQHTIKKKKGRKNRYITRPAQFKPILFKGKLYFQWGAWTLDLIQPLIRLAGHGAPLARTGNAMGSLPFLFPYPGTTITQNMSLHISTSPLGSATAPLSES